MTLKLIVLLFFLGLIYILLPGARAINDFPPIPRSFKSQLEGDTIQNPNIAAYFSDFRRENITKYYKSFFESSLLPLHIPFPAITLNHPPEEAYQYVRDQQESTFLEEYLRPLRESIYVNGYEPEIENQMHHAKSSYLGNHIEYKGKLYTSKTTLRYYPSNIFIRIFVYLGIWISMMFVVKLYAKAAKE